MVTPYWSDGIATLHLGDCRAVMAAMESAFVDAVVTDPPYELAFMGRSWDARGIAYDVSVWRECLRLLRPGGYLLAFGGTRTYHRLACAVEDAGFEIRDSLHWIHGSGFPKGKACLKPAHEPIVMARKPDKRSAPLPGLDGCRVGIDATCEGQNFRRHGNDYASNHERKYNEVFGEDRQERGGYYSDAGRWPPNVLLGEEAAAELDRQSGDKPPSFRNARTTDPAGDTWALNRTDQQPFGFGDSGGASRFFPVFRYQAKAPASERPRLEDGTAHPTVKPLGLMRWLVRLITPSGGLVLDPFAGSGTTAEAARLEGFRAVCIDDHEPYAALAARRLSQGVLKLA